MRKFFSLLLLLLFFLIIIPSNSFSQIDYAVTRLTDNQYEDLKPHINDNNDVVWQGFDGNDFEIFFLSYSESLIYQITDNSYDDMYAQINNRGDIAWQGREGGNRQIFLYESASGYVWEIASGSAASHSNTFVPYMNNNGDIVWQVYEDSRYNIHYYDFDLEESYPITDDIIYNNYNPRINDNKDITWSRHYSDNLITFSDYYDIMVYFYRLGVFQQIWTQVIPMGEEIPSPYELEPKINNSVNIVWEAYDFVLNDFEIFYYALELGGTIQLTDNSYNDTLPGINSNGDVVWVRSALNTNGENIFFYNSETVEIIQITNSEEGSYWETTLPQISDMGIITWQASVAGPSGLNTDIYIHDGSDITNISDSVDNDYSPFINSAGNIVWTAKAEEGEEIFLATLIEEEDDGDGDEDKGGFPNCFIATACYGTPMAAEIKTFRTFRDKYLMSNPGGKTIVSIYNTFGPRVADFIREKESLKFIIRVCLKPFLWIISRIVGQ